MMKSKTRNLSRMTLCILALVLLGAYLLSFSGTATAASTHAGIKSTPSKLVGVDIVKRHGKAVYVPTILHLKVNQHFNSLNDTNVTQTETWHGQPLVSIPPHQNIVAWWTGKGTYILGLQSNPHAKLTIIVS